MEELLKINKVRQQLAQKVRRGDGACFLWLDVIFPRLLGQKNFLARFLNELVSFIFVPKPSMYMHLLICVNLCSWFSSKNVGWTEGRSGKKYICM